MDVLKKRIFSKTLLLVLISSISFSLNGLSKCYSFPGGNCSDHSTLSPEIALDTYDITSISRNMIIDSYIEQSLLSEFEYRSLKLDSIFNTRVNPSLIEQQIKEVVSKEDLIVYFSDRRQDQGKRSETRLRIRKLFNFLLEEYGYKPFTLSEYQDKIIEKLLELHRHDLKYNGEFRGMNISWQVLSHLSPEEVLVFRSQPSSMAEHALKNKIMTFAEPALRENGIAADDEAWKLLSRDIENRKEKMLGFFKFYTAKHEKELKQKLLDNFSLRDIAYYFADTAGFNLENQDSRKRMYAFFVDWMKELDEKIKRDPHMIKLNVYNEGKTWEYRYKVRLDNIVRDLLEIDVDSYELSVKKMLAKNVDIRDKKKISKALNIMHSAARNILNLKPADYKTYHRIRSVNSSGSQQFIYIDDAIVISIGDGIWRSQPIVAEKLYMDEQSNTVLCETNNPENGQTEMFIFTENAPYVRVAGMKNDYSRMFKDKFKEAFLKEFTLSQLRDFSDYVYGEPEDWQRAYQLSVRINEFCEKFFSAKFGIDLDRAVWSLVLDVTADCLAGKKTLSEAESQMLDIALPFKPMQGIMRLNKRNFGFMPLENGKLLETASSQIMLGQSI